jgi:hypothetical protein
MDAARNVRLDIEGIRSQVAERKQEVDIKQAEPHHVSPRQGAYMRKVSDSTSPLQYFNGWVDKTTFRLVNVDEPVEANEYEALVPAHHGLAYARATGLPDSGHRGDLVAVTGWRGLNPLVRVHGQTSSQAWSANTVAGLMPILNPQFESIKHKADRLEREKALLEFGLHHRMVAEGVARSWCNEFDPILDSTGLMPRKGKQVVMGQMTFRTALSGYNLSDPAVLEAIKAKPWDYIPVRDIKIVEMEAEAEPQGPMLS